MKLAIVVLAHDRPDQLALLLAALRHPRVLVYLHIDRRAPMGPFAKALSDAGVRDVTLLPRYPTPWGSPKLVDAALQGLARGVGEGCDYFVLLSGQDFPLRPMEEILAFLEGAGPSSYVEYFPLPDARWRFEGRDRIDFYTYTVMGRRETCIPRGEDTSFLGWKGRLLNELLRARSSLKGSRHSPPYVRPFGGSQWWNLSRDAAAYIIDFVGRNPDFRLYHEHTLLTEEVFFQSILLGTEFAGRDKIVNETLRFMSWPEGESHPRVLRMEDFSAMLRSERLFARKFDSATEPDVLARLREQVTG